MENLNAQQVKKALECCASPTQMCKDCPMPEEVKDDCRCMETISRNALSLIKELTEENGRLEKLCALRDQDNKDTQDLLYKAEAENERLMRDKTALECIVETARNQAKVDTVRKMQERLKGAFNFGHTILEKSICDIIDQIAKEMLEGEKHEI